MTFPEDSLQAMLQPDDWWVKNEGHTLCRGALVFAFAPHIDQIPYCFEPVGRSKATEHGAAVVKVTPLKVDEPLKGTSLPVAAMTLHDKEIWAAYRAKKRPCLVLGEQSPHVNRELTKGKAGHSTAPTMLLAPYYGIAHGVKRAGYSAEFVERVRHCEFPQFVWDHLPIPKGEESILRLDHLQPIGAHLKSYKLSGYKLSDDALEIVDELLQWLVWGGVPEDGYIVDYRETIESEL